MVHNLMFAKELQKTLCTLTQDVRTDPVLSFFGFPSSVFLVSTCLLAVEGSEEGHAARAGPEG